MYYLHLFIILLIAILVIIYVWTSNKDYFTVGYDLSFLYQEPLNYNTREQDCNELTYNPTHCVVDTVIPSNKIVCTESLTPITNNEKDCEVKDKKDTKKSNLSLINDFDLLSSFNNSQIANNKIANDELESFDDLKTDVKSLASLENDNITNY